MKRIIIGILCLTLVFAAAISVHGAGTAMSLSVSSDTVYRGDTVTVTVRLTNTAPLTNGSLSISCGQGLTLLDGECNISGVTIGSVSTSQKICSFAFDTGVAKAVSGTIFTLRFRAKSDAAFAKATISVTASLQNMNTTVYSGSAGSSVTVACKHSYGTPVKTDGNSHQLTCKICGQTKSEGHSYTSQVTKAATCKDTGAEKLTCACGYSKNQTIAKTDDHSYGAYSKVSSSQHSRTCKVCGKQQTTSHSWNSGTVTQAATCKDTGTRVRKCTGCGARKTETIALSTTHPYPDWESVDENAHSRSCPTCGNQETASHSFDSWGSDETGHYQLCADCGQQGEHASHVPGREATETTDQICTVCQQILQPALNHTHQYGDSWDSDGESHWRSCTVCGQRSQEAAHSPGEAATFQSAQCCTVCGFQLAARLTHDVHDFSPEHSHTCQCGETYTAAADCPLCAAERKTFPWWIVIVAENVILVGAAVFFLIRKKQKSTPS